MKGLEKVCGGPFRTNVVENPSLLCFTIFFQVTRRVLYPIFCIFMQQLGGVQQLSICLPFISTPQVYSIPKPNPSNGEGGCSTPSLLPFLRSSRVCKLKYKYKYSILKMIHSNIEFMLSSPLDGV